MEGSAKIISLIARDENQHLALTQNILNYWRRGDDPDMLDIIKEEESNVYDMFAKAVNEEKTWAEYLFRDGSMIGLNDKLLSQYIEWIANRRMKSIGLKPMYDIPDHIILYLGLLIGLVQRDYKWHHKRQRLNPMSLVVLNRM